MWVYLGATLTGAILAGLFGTLNLRVIKGEPLCGGGRAAEGPLIESEVVADAAIPLAGSPPEDARRPGPKTAVGYTDYTDSREEQNAF